jgi:hypothetical protein
MHPRPTPISTYNNKPDPSRHDPVVGISRLLGLRNRSDSMRHDDAWAFRRHGPISRLTLFKAWYYDGEWHDPGELKGMQSWCAWGARGRGLSRLTCMQHWPR